MTRRRLVASLPVRGRLPAAIVGLLLLASPATETAGAQAPRLTLVRSIGCGECGGPVEFGAIVDVAVDDSGGVLLLDSDAPVVRRFDPRGAHRWSAGAAGSGPGEFRRAIWGMLSPSGVQVVDMSARRVTRLDHAGANASSATFRGFPAAVAAEGNTGGFVILVDDFRGGYRLERWTPGDSGRPHHAIPPATEPRASGAIVFTALAASRDGGIALVRDINAYAILVLGPDGEVRRTITRDLPPPRRTPEEIAAQERLRQRSAERAAARVAAERGAAPAGPTPAAPRPSGDPAVKPHIAIDGLQYDDAGRLWVRTMRGDHRATVLDVFAPSGAFLGEVRLEGTATAFALAGQWLAVAAEDPDGYPVVRVYRVS